jgi:hypothetical protein
VANLIDRTNEMTARVCGANPRAVFADLRGSGQVRELLEIRV